MTLKLRSRHFISKFRCWRWLQMLIGIGLIGLSLAACSQPTSTPEPTPQPSATPTLSLPTATSVPLAASVNGESITLAEFQAELARYQMAFGTELATQAQQNVIEDMIAKVLLAQAAREGRR